MHWNTEKDLLLILANQDHLEQVFINLLVNARDVIEEKWKFKEYKKGSKKITFITRSDIKQVLVEICNTSPGIPKDISDKIFEPFFTTKEVGESTGLGLSISYGIIKECGGNIKVASSNAEGTCFVITFPIPYKEKLEG